MKNLSKEYARALFELSEEENIDSIIFDELSEISNIFDENPKYVELLSSYAVGNSEKMSILEDAFKSKINNYLLNFLKIIVENHQIRFLKTCLSEYENIYNEKHNILVVTVYTPVRMTQDQIERLTSKLEHMTRKKIYILNKIDNSLIGGIKISYNEKCINLSLENYFEELHHNLKISDVSL